jgi:hypothetical protein
MKDGLIIEPQVCFDARWRICKDEQPNRNTPHAGKYGVTVLGFDLDEYLDSGYCNPFDVNYNFKKQQFIMLAYGNGKTSWVPACITHWMPLPPVPVQKLKIASIRPAMTKHGIPPSHRLDKKIRIFEKVSTK